MRDFDSVPAMPPYGIQPRKRSVRLQCRKQGIVIHFHVGADYADNFALMGLGGD